MCVCVCVCGWVLGWVGGSVSLIGMVQTCRWNSPRFDPINLSVGKFFMLFV